MHVKLVAVVFLERNSAPLQACSFSDDRTGSNQTSVLDDGAGGDPHAFADDAVTHDAAVAKHGSLKDVGVDDLA